MRYAGRLFVQAPGFTIPAIAILALGVGANTAIFSVVHTVLLKPYGYRDAGRVVMFQNTLRGGPRSGSAAPVEFNWWRDHAGAVEDISAYAFNTANLTGDGLAEQVPILQVSAHFFRLCGAGAAYGRTFTTEDDRPNAERRAVVAYRFWRERLGGDRRVIGRRVTLGGERYEIIGVAGAALEKDPLAEQSLLSGDVEIDEPPAVYVPLRIDANSGDRGHSFNVAGRLRAGTSVAAANAQLAASYAEYARRWTGLTPGAGFAVEPLQQAIVGSVRSRLLLLAGAVGLVLLMACANVATLLLARSSGRAREIAIRAALGASRRQIVLQLLTESAVLSLAAGAAGLAAGYGGVRALLLIGPAIPRVGAEGARVGLDWRVAGFAFGLSLATSVAAGLAPALAAARRDLAGALQWGGRSSAGPRRSRVRALLVATELALAVVLSIGAGLAMRSFAALRQTDPGFDAGRVLTVRMSLAGPQFAEPAAQARLFHEGVRRLRALPGVEAAATACCVPLDSRLQMGFTIAGRAGGVAGWVESSAGYFETFGIPILRGRTFTERDESGPPVAIVNAALARQFWGDGDPLGDRIAIGRGPAMAIVGVAGDVRDAGMDRAARPTVYVASVTPGRLLGELPWSWAIRTGAKQRPSGAAIERELRAASGLPVGRVRGVDEVVARSVAAQRFETAVMGVFGGAAILLAAIGIYGLAAQAVASRRHEIGIRLAVGAAPGQIRSMVIKEGLRTAAAGMACGMAGAWALARMMPAVLFGVKARDPLVFGAVPAVLAMVALIAVWLPAERASRVEAVRVLGQE